MATDDTVSNPSVITLTGKTSPLWEAKPGDWISEEDFNYMVNVLPPASWVFNKYVQVGEPQDHRGPRHRARYDTAIMHQGKPVACGKMTVGHIPTIKEANNEATD